MTKPSLLILAAGMGSRFGGLKQLEAMGPGGETIMDYSVYDAIKAGFGKIVFVVREFFKKEFEERFLERYGSQIEIAFVVQEPHLLPSPFKALPERSKPWGTGHAVLTAAQEIKTPFAVINADDYYGNNSFRIISDYLKTLVNKNGEFCMVGFKAQNTLSISGSVSRGICSADDKGFLTSVEEHHKIREENGIIYGNNQKSEKVVIDPETYVSMNMWGFTPDLFKEADFLFTRFLEDNISNNSAEFYIPSVVNTLINEGYARCKILHTPDSWFGVTYKEDKDFVSEQLLLITNNGTYPVPLFETINQQK
jgi:NDP-sugar pyrophosphorylase family protein